VALEKNENEIEFRLDYSMYEDAYVFNGTELRALQDSLIRPSSIVKKVNKKVQRPGAKAVADSYISWSLLRCS